MASAPACGVYHNLGAFETASFYESLLLPTFVFNVFSTKRYGRSRRLVTSRPPY
jgi:hypothetical protein